MPDTEPYWRQMRAIMYQPTEVWLVTDKDGERWLTDQYVLLKVTAAEEFGELADGAYKIAFVSKGPEPREAPVDFDINGYLASMQEREWWPADPTMWSVIEDYQGKAMLWDANSTPVLMGEPTWSAIKRHYPGVLVEHSWRGNSVFRFSHQFAKGSTFADGTEWQTFAYAAGIKMPEGQLGTAAAIVKNLAEPGIKVN